MKEKPKAKQTGKPKTKRAETTRGAQTAQGANPSAHDTANPSEPVGNGTAQGAGNGAGFCLLFALYLLCLRAGGGTVDLYEHNREQVRRFISELPKDCALICDAVKQSLFDDGAGLLEDEELYKRLGRIAYIDNFIRYFGDCLAVEDMAVFLNDLVPRNMKTAGGAYDLKILERVPNVDIQLMGDILSAGDDYTSMHNLTLYYFSLWVNFHVGAVVSMFRKWVEVYGENVPPLLRDMSALARCDCVYTRTEDNANGGIFFDGSWLESFAMCGERRRKRNAEAARERDAAAARDLARTVAEPVARPNPSADGPAHDMNPPNGKTAKIGTWATMQGATAYFVGVSVCINGTVCKLPPVTEKRGRMIADLIETNAPLGAVVCDVHSAMGGDTSSAEYSAIMKFLERVNAGKRGKSANPDFAGCWHIKPKPAEKK